ncbi:MAG: AAA family ATPase [Candidatus Spechtbacterales bacterium]|nr:AAA family ATPase [Candidatus Spechtbacterales bacterium]
MSSSIEQSPSFEGDKGKKDKVSPKERDNMLEYWSLKNHEAALEGADKKLVKIDAFQESEDLVSRLNSIRGFNEEEESETEMAQDLQKAKEGIREIEETLGEDTVEELKQEGLQRIRAFERKRRELLKIEEDLKQAINQTISKIYQDPELSESSGVWDRINRLQEQLASIPEAIETLSRQSPEAFLWNQVKWLREQKRLFESSGIIETPGIKKITGEIFQDVRKKLEGRNGIVTLLGPTGSGKTVLARKIGEEFSIDGEYEFVSAHSKMLPEDLLYRLGIKVDSVEAEDVPELIKEAQDRYEQKNPDLDNKELEQAKQTIARVVQDQAKEKAFKTEKIEEAVIRAASEGKVLVIDEFNYLPPETLASLNNLLSTRPGEVVSFGDDQIEVHEGFRVVFTGNVGEEYIKRQKLDPALVNRVLSGIVKYEYPPQEIDRPLNDSVLDSESIEAGEDPPNRDLFLSGLVQLADRNGNLVAPEDTLEKTWDLSRAFALIQQLAEGKDLRDLGIENEYTQDVSSFDIDTVFLSFRDFNNVIREWSLDSYAKPIDWYVYKNIIRPASVVDPKEAAQLYWSFKQQGQMFKGDEWSDIKVNPQTWSISGTFKISEDDIPSNKVENKLFGVKELAELASGEEAPSVVKSEQIADRKQQIDSEQIYLEMEKYLEEMEKDLRDESFVEELCA